MNPKGRLGTFWEFWFRFEFQQTLEDLRTKMIEIELGKQKYPVSYETRLSKVIPASISAFILEEVRFHNENYERFEENVAWLARERPGVPYASFALRGFDEE